MTKADPLQVRGHFKLNLNHDTRNARNKTYKWNDRGTWLWVHQRRRRAKNAETKKMFPEPQLLGDLEQEGRGWGGPGVRPPSRAKMKIKATP